MVCKRSFTELFIDFLSIDFTRRTFIKKSKSSHIITFIDGRKGKSLEFQQSIISFSQDAKIKRLEQGPLTSQPSPRPTAIRRTGPITHPLATQTKTSLSNNTTKPNPRFVSISLSIQ